MSTLKTKHKLYKTWSQMKQRCHNPSNKAYPNYGARGIRVCDRWMDSFESFVFDMGAKPSPRLSIDRIDNNKGYSPSNCRWATSKEQNRNTRRNHYLFYKGKDTLLIDVAEDIGITQQALQGRLNKMTMEDALYLPANPDKKRYIEAHGKLLTLDGWAKELNVGRSCIERRLAIYSPEKALDKNGNIRAETIVNKRRVEQLTATGEHVGFFESLMAAGKATNINFRNIQTVCKGDRNKAGGFQWRYAV